MMIQIQGGLTTATERLDADVATRQFAGHLSSKRNNVTKFTNVCFSRALPSLSMPVLVYT